LFEECCIFGWDRGLPVGVMARLRSEWWGFRFQEGKKSCSLKNTQIASGTCPSLLLNWY
jgi:hypothetical protein